MFKEKTCPNCMSLYRGSKCKNCGFIDNEEKIGIRTVWKFIIAYMIIQVSWGAFTSSDFISALFVTLVAWFILLLIPCILKYSFKISLSRKFAILYTFISAFILLLGNVIIDILCKEYLHTQQTTTVWNILMMIVPYYILTDAPMFGTNKDNLQKEKSKTSEKQIASFKIPTFKIPKLPQIKLTNNLTIVLAVLIVAIAYIFVEQNKLNYKEKVRQENIAEQQEQQEALDSCLTNAETDYNSNWNHQCKSIGLKDDCTLPSHRADTVEKWRTNARKECMDKYKNKAF